MEISLVSTIPLPFCRCCFAVAVFRSVPCDGAVVPLPFFRSIATVAVGDFFP